MLQPLALKARLHWQAARCQHDILGDYCRSLTRVLTLPMSQASLVAMDLEMTGLDPVKDQILSMALIPLEAGRLQLGLATQKLVRINGSVGQSATIHGIVDHQLDGAVEIDEAMAWFIQQTRGKVIVAHHAPLDLGFIQNAIARAYGQSIRIPAIDTLAIERRRLLRQQDALADGSLRLAACRSRYGLPLYGAHDALIDALACGELLLAQLGAIGQLDKIRVTELVSLA